MKSLLVHLIYCGGLIFLILLGANIAFVLGWLRNNLLVLFPGLLVTAAVIFYVWRQKWLGVR